MYERAREDERAQQRGDAVACAIEGQRVGRQPVGGQRRKERQVVRDDQRQGPEQRGRNERLKSRVGVERQVHAEWREQAIGEEEPRV